MDREQAKALLPIIKAFSEGKIIEYRDSMLKDDWKIVKEIPNLSFGCFEYRIKPEHQYRPFKDTKECWQEMQKHQPFGWLKVKDKDSELRNIQALTEKMSTIADGVCFRGINLINGWHVFEEAVKEYTFLDGTPFGVKIEEDKQ